MNEENKPTQSADTSPKVQPDIGQAAGDNVAPTADGDIKIPVKFNKQVRLLDAEEAATLAQKGMKFDMISADFERFKRLAAADGHSVGDYLSRLEKSRAEARLAELTEKCGGDSALAEHIMSLENGAAAPDTSGLSELREQFPEIEDISRLPEEVVESAKLKGSSLLDEYLRYLHRAERQAHAENESSAAAASASVGPQRQTTAPTNPERNEFIRALWGR